MKRFIAALLCALVVMGLGGCTHKYKTVEDMKKPADALNWFELRSVSEYHQFCDDYGDMLSEEEFQELKKIMLSGGRYVEMCFRHTFEDGTQILVIMEPLDSRDLEWKEVRVKDVEIIHP